METVKSRSKPESANHQKLSFREQIAQWTVLLLSLPVTFFIASAVNGSVSNFGAFFEAGLDATFCLYLWQPSTYGRRKKIWWLTYSGKHALFLLFIAALSGLRIHHDNGFLHLDWQENWLFWNVLWVAYVVAWSFIRTAVVEAVGEKSHTEIEQ